MKRVRIEFSSIELDVIDDALSSYTYELADEVSLANDSCDSYAIMEAQERKRALDVAIEKVDKARKRVS